MRHLVRTTHQAAYMDVYASYGNVQTKVSFYFQYLGAALCNIRVDQFYLDTQSLFFHKTFLNDEGLGHDGPRIKIKKEDGGSNGERNSQEKKKSQRRVLSLIR